MKAAQVLLFLLLFVTGSGIAVAEDAAHSPADEQEWVKIRAIKQKYEDAAKAGEVDSIAPYLSEKFSGVVLTGEEINSFAELKEYNRKMHEMIGEGATHDMQIHYAPGFMLGDIAVAHGTTDEVVITSLKNRFAFKSFWTTVLLKEKGDWKIFRLQQSMNPVANEFVETFTARKLRWWAGGALVVGLIAGLLIGRMGRKTT